MYSSVSVTVADLVMMCKEEPCHKNVMCKEEPCHKNVMSALLCDEIKDLQYYGIKSSVQVYLDQILSYLDPNSSPDNSDIVETQ